MYDIIKFSSFLRITIKLFQWLNNEPLKIKFLDPTLQVWGDETRLARKVSSPSVLRRKGGVEKHR